MVTIKKTDQGGSVATFILVGIILIALLFGSVYYVKQRGEQARKDQAISAYDKHVADEDDKHVSTSTNVETVVAEKENPEVLPEVLSSSDSLPNTGAGTPVAELIGIFAITAALTSYFGSRRDLARYL